MSWDDGFRRQSDFVKPILGKDIFPVWQENPLQWEVGLSHRRGPVDQLPTLGLSPVIGIQPRADSVPWIRAPFNAAEVDVRTTFRFALAWWLSAVALAMVT